MSVREVTVRFDYDAKHALYVVYPCGRMATEAGCIDWYQQFVREFTPLGHRVDMVVVLDMFTMETSVASVFGDYREQLHTNFTRHTVRVQTGEHEMMIAQYRLQRDIAPDIASAIALIERRRAEASLHR